MNGQDILNDIGLKAYEPPLSTIRDLPIWPSLTDPLHVVILLVDFDTEVSMNGLLGFLENSTGAYLDQTIEAFRIVGATQTAETLSRVREVMSRRSVSYQRLREPHHHTTEYQITSFRELHGSALDDFADEVSRVGDALYIHHRSQDSPWPLVEAYLERHVTEIQSELQRIRA